ncbi:MAG: glycoside hydrolase family 88 protein, partial [Phaeodactylibacter sp.]|nr:glycoside hydrolase family 88 protein [Phaeodactylibacter sp.]
NGLYYDTGTLHLRAGPVELKKLFHRAGEFSRYFVLVALAVSFCLSGCAATPPSDDKALVSAAALEAKLQALSEKALSYLSQLPPDSLAIPRALRADGSLHATGSKDWTSGFYPGELWQLYEFSKKDELAAAAAAWTAFVEKEKYDTHTHDLGFKIYCSFGQGFRLTDDPGYKKVILEASRTLIQRYNEKVGCIRSWDFNAETWQFPVIIDNMMNLEMLFAATRLSGDSTYYKIAYQHALTTLNNHIREDHSAYHVIDYDTLTGEVRHWHTHQGAGPASAWARGQAWNIYGFAMAYRETRDKRFLEQAKAAARFFYTHPNLPQDHIPYWDFDAPYIPNEPRDASAAAITACGLLMLCELDPPNREQFLKWADSTLVSLNSDKYQSAALPFLLGHSVGSIPGAFEIDVPIIYADYYYVEALMKRLALAKSNNG